MVSFVDKGQMWIEQKNSMLYIVVSAAALSPLWYGLHIHKGEKQESSHL